MGLTMQERQAVTREYKPRYQKATKKSKQILLDEFVRLTAYHRKSAVRLLTAKPVSALPHGKCYRKGVMPQIENVTQILVRTPGGGRPNGVNYEGTTGRNEGI